MKLHILLELLPIQHMQYQVHRQQDMLLDRDRMELKDILVWDVKKEQVVVEEAGMAAAHIQKLFQKITIVLELAALATLEEFLMDKRQLEFEKGTDMQKSLGVLHYN